MPIYRNTCLRSALTVLALALIGGCGASQPDIRHGGEAHGTVDAQPKSVDTFLAAVEAYEEGRGNKKPDLALVERLLRRAISQQSDFTEAWFNLGVVLDEQGRHQEAKKAYKRALELDGQFMDAMANLGLLSMQEGDREQAIESFRHAVEIESFNTTALNNLAVVSRQNAVTLRESGNGEQANQYFAEAVRNVRKVLAADPQNIPAYNNLALIYYELGRYQLAQMVCITAMKFEEKDPAIHNNLGLILLKLNLIIDATRQFEAAIELNPDYSEARMNLGAIMLNFRDYTRAFQQFSKVVEQYPRHLSAMLSRSVAARGMGEYDVAEQGYKEVLKLDSSNGPALFNLALLQQDYLQKPTDALATFQKFLNNIGEVESSKVEEAQGRVNGLLQLIEILKKQEQQVRDAPKSPGDSRRVDFQLSHES